MKEMVVGRVAKAAGISREQAALAIAAIPDPPSGGPAYTKRMDALREVALAFGLNVWHMSDATLEKRLCRYDGRVARLIRMAKEADAANSSA